MPRLSHGKGEGAAGTRLRCGTLLFGSLFPASARPPLRSSSASCPPRRAAPLRPAALPVPQTRGPNPAQPPGRSRRVPSEHLFLPISQNHRMVRVGRDLCGSPSWKGPLWVTQSNPLPKQGHPEQAAQHLVSSASSPLEPPPATPQSPPLTFVGEGTGGATGEVSEGVGITGATSGVCAGVLGSLLLISPPEAEAEPEGPAVPLDAAELGVRVGCKTARSGEKVSRAGPKGDNASTARPPPAPITTTSATPISSDFGQPPPPRPRLQHG